MVFGFRKFAIGGAVAFACFAGQAMAQEPVTERPADPRIDKQLLGKSEKAADSPYYPLQVGTTWVYSVTSPQTPNKEEISTEIVMAHNKVEDQLVAFIEKRVNTESGVMTASNQYIGTIKDDVCRFGYLNFRISPAFCFLKPGKKGDTWDVNSTIQTASELSPQRSNGTFELDEQEVTVPAGTYKCLVVRSKGMMSGRDPITVTTYYAKGVGPDMQEVEKQGTQVISKLKSFTMGTGKVTSVAQEAGSDDKKKTDESKTPKPAEPKKAEPAKKN